MVGGCVVFELLVGLEGGPYNGRCRTQQQEMQSCDLKFRQHICVQVCSYMCNVCMYVMMYVCNVM